MSRSISESPLDFEIMKVDCIFLILHRKKGFDISCKLSPLETICIESQNLFSRQNMGQGIFQQINSLSQLCSPKHIPLQTV